MICLGCKDCILRDGLWPTHHCRWTGVRVFPNDHKADQRGGYNCPLDMLDIRRKSSQLRLSKKQTIGIIGSIICEVENRGLLSEFLERHSEKERAKLLYWQAAYKMQQAVA